MFRSRLFLGIGLGVALALAFGAGSASADTFSSTLGIANDDITGNPLGFPAPYGEVLVTLNSPTTATVKFTSDVVGNNIYLFGGATAVDVNVNATTWSIGSFSASNAGTGFSTVSTDYSDGGPKTVNGFGIFNQTVTGFDGFSHSADTVSFVLTNTSGTWGSAAQVLAANAAGNDAAAHIFVTPFPANQSAGALQTGKAAETETVVPEPSTMAIAGLGALGFIGYGLRRRLKK